MSRASALAIHSAAWAFTWGGFSWLVALSLTSFLHVLIPVVCRQKIFCLLNILLLSCLLYKYEGLRWFEWMVDGCQNPMKDFGSGQSARTFARKVAWCILVFLRLYNIDTLHMFSPCFHTNAWANECTTSSLLMDELAWHRSEKDASFGYRKGCLKGMKGMEDPATSRVLVCCSLFPYWKELFCTSPPFQKFPEGAKSQGKFKPFSESISRTLFLEPQNNATPNNTIINKCVIFLIRTRKVLCQKVD